MFRAPGQYASGVGIFLRSSVAIAWLGVLGDVALAGEIPANHERQFAVGECVLFREGGVGKIFKTPTYWVKGRVTEVFSERKLAGRCPTIDKPMQSFSHNDWVRLVAAYPCVANDADVREVETRRIRLAVDAWETPWSLQHGTVGWLFRGAFLDKVLEKGTLLELDANWLESCAS